MLYILSPLSKPEYIYNKLMTAEDSVKSIIYGNCVANTYGKFRALCAALTDLEHVEKAVTYLRTVENLRKFNKYIYAYRLDEEKTVFMTEENRNKEYDPGVEGCGERLLHLMQRFNVKNILLIVAIGQNNIFQVLGSDHQMSILKCAKQLLVSLYNKVLPVTQQPQSDPKPASIPQKLFVLPDIYNPPKFKDEKIKQNNRPNYVGKLFIPQKSKTKEELRVGYEIKYLNNKIKDLAYDLQNLISYLGEEQNASIRFTIQYDESEMVQKVIKLLLVLFGFQSKLNLMKADISTSLRQVSIKTLSNKTINSLNLMLLSNPDLKSQKIGMSNKFLGIVVEFIQALMKSYGFAKKIALIETSVEQATDRKNRKHKSKSMFGKREDFSRFQ